MNKRNSYFKGQCSKANRLNQHAQDSGVLPPLPARFPPKLSAEHLARVQQIANWKPSSLQASNAKNEDAPSSPSSKDKREPDSNHRGEAEPQNESGETLPDDELFLQEVLRSLRKLEGKVQIR